MLIFINKYTIICGCVGKIEALLQALVLRVGSWGLQMCCNVGGVAFFIFCGRKKKNKFPSDLQCPIKKAKSFLFSNYHYRF
jgi:hypothetical protein